MTIEEMKAKGYLRYTAYIEKLIVTKAVEVWAKNFDDACTIVENAAGKLPDNLIIRKFKRYMKAVIHSAVFLRHNQR